MFFNNVFFKYIFNSLKDTSFLYASLWQFLTIQFIENFCHRIIPLYNNLKTYMIQGFLCLLASTFDIDDDDKLLNFHISFEFK
jgi:hypothetical protein